MLILIQMLIPTSDVEDWFRGWCWLRYRNWFGDWWLTLIQKLILRADKADTDSDNWFEADADSDVNTDSRGLMDSETENWFRRLMLSRYRNLEFRGLSWLSWQWLWCRHWFDVEKWFRSRHWLQTLRQESDADTDSDARHPRFRCRWTVKVERIQNRLLTRTILTPFRSWDRWLRYRNRFRRWHWDSDVDTRFRQVDSDSEVDTDSDVRNRSDVEVDPDFDTDSEMLILIQRLKLTPDVETDTEVETNWLSDTEVPTMLTMILTSRLPRYRKPIQTLKLIRPLRTDSDVETDSEAEADSDADTDSDSEVDADYDFRYWLRSNWDRLGCRLYWFRGWNWLRYRDWFGRWNWLGHRWWSRGWHWLGRWY